jgi:hypothetical protein
MGGGPCSRACQTLGYSDPLPVILPERQARVGGEFELFHPVRLEAVRAPDALAGTRVDADAPRHHRGGPVGRLGGGAVWVSVTTRSVMPDASGGMNEGVSCRAGGCRNLPP